MKIRMCIIFSAVLALFFCLSSGCKKEDVMDESDRDVVITSVESENAYIPAKEIFIKEKNISLQEGEEKKLMSFLLPMNTTEDRSLIYESKDQSVVKVDSEGCVTAVSEGKTTVTVTSKNGLKEEVSIEVTKYIPVESFSINASNIKITNDTQLMKLFVAVTPKDTTEEIIWTSSDETVVTVDENGVLFPVSNGTSIISATAGTFTEECEVTVDIKDEYIIVLDPGHNSKFTGAKYSGIKEEVINLKVANVTKEYLESHYKGVTVILTREDGTPMGDNLVSDLEKRAQFAQNVGAFFLVSQHFNASLTHDASGSLAFVSFQSEVKEPSKALGDTILKYVSKATGLRNSGCVTTESDKYFDENDLPLDYYAINRHCAKRGIPGIIIEHCFMDVDTRYLNNDWLTVFGRCDAEGIAEYLGLEKITD